MKAKTVEEARAEILDTHVDHARLGDWVPIPDKLDELVRAVRAEMPCRYWAWRQTCDQRWDVAEIDKWCPSCKAREDG